jgi:hypothetical protein
MTFIAGNRLAYTKLLKLRPDQALDAQVVALEHGSDDRQIECSRERPDLTLYAQMRSDPARWRRVLLLCFKSITPLRGCCSSEPGWISICCSAARTMIAGRQGRSPAGGIHVRYLYPIQDPQLQALPLDLIHASTQEEAIRRPDVAPLRSALPGRGDLRRPGADR